jgi:hypothetical protein
MRYNIEKVTKYIFHHLGNLSLTFRASFNPG